MRRLRIRVRVWGNGYATEAVFAVVRYCFEVLNERAVVAFTRPENHRSAQVLQKAGFQFRGEHIEDGAYIICNVYELSIGGWKEMRAGGAAQCPHLA